MAERWIVDENGQRTAVVLEIDQYNHMLEDRDELDEIRTFEEAKSTVEQTNKTKTKWKKRNKIDD